MTKDEITSELRLKRANLRATRHRIIVLDALSSVGRPLTHQEILNRIDTYLDKVTLYRILSSLKDASLIHQVQGNDGIWRFCSHDEDSLQCPGGHPHLLCESCGKMFCLHDCRMQHIEVPSHFKVTHKQMLIIGICEDCQHQTENALHTKR